ncbi:Cilia- And Flagella-Associated Protein 54 [Manis pentadactyla]|nr:Cilia- And Flagella-Associated Protein 54 [Manis pentadactyla]
MNHPHLQPLQCPPKLSIPVIDKMWMWGTKAQFQATLRHGYVATAEGNLWSQESPVTSNKTQGFCHITYPTTPEGKEIVMLSFYPSNAPARGDTVNNENFLFEKEKSLLQLHWSLAHLPGPVPDHSQTLGQNQVEESTFRSRAREFEATGRAAPKLGS